MKTKLVKLIDKNLLNRLNTIMKGEDEKYKFGLHHNNTNEIIFFLVYL